MYMNRVVSLFWFMYISFDSCTSLLIHVRLFWCIYCTSLLIHTQTCRNEKRRMYISSALITINKDQKQRRVWIKSCVSSDSCTSLLIHVHLLWFLHCRSLLNHTRTCMNQKRLMDLSFDVTTINKDQKQWCTWVEWWVSFDLCRFLLIYVRLF